ncbi:MAG: hemerythrin domain-containing protein [Minicystis sp.]
MIPLENSASYVVPQSLGEALRADHRRLEILFDELENLVHVGDTIRADEAWSRFERGLVAHLDAEEDEMLPILDLEDAEEAARVRREHQRIRKLLAELGIQLEIHILREDTVRAFLDFLRTHAAREEETLYRWADRALPEAPKTSILQRVRGTLERH